MIYLDNAASSHPKPPQVYRAVMQHLKKNGANPGRSGHGLSLEASRVVFSARQTLATLFGADPELILFTQNTTDAINKALKGLLHPGDHVLISDLEHNSVLRPLVALKQKGITFDTVSVEEENSATLKNFTQALTQNTKLVFCTHASNVTGQILPIRDIGNLCRARGILFGVDGAQTAGTEAYQLKKDPIDFLCIPGHKGLLSPQGTGALILSAPLPLTPLIEGGTGTESLNEGQPISFPEGFESGTLNTPGIAGLNAGAEFILKNGEKIRAWEQHLRQRFLQSIKPLSAYHILGSGTDFVSTVALFHETLHSETLCSLLDRHGICTRGGYQCSALTHKKLHTEARGALRISFGYKNTEKDVEECVKFLKKYQNYRATT